MRTPSGAPTRGARKTEIRDAGPEARRWTRREGTRAPSCASRSGVRAAAS